MIDFDSASRDILSEFLQTAIVIDDAAYPFGEKAKSVTELRTPGRVQAKADVEPEPPAKSQSAHSVDTSLLVDSFARKGLVLRRHRAPGGRGHGEASRSRG